VKTQELTHFAAEQQRRFDSSTSADERKSQGHFGTPPGIAAFMAAMFSDIPTGTVRILDPGAGVGTLSAAVCQRMLTLTTPRTLFFELWENDRKLLSILEATMNRCQKALRAAGHAMEFSIRNEDFILANTRRTLFESGPEPSFHRTILNPPYFKLRKESPQARAMGHVVHGQPNIYALFMAVAADLLLPEGEMVAITPRSYFNGLYFKKFRKWFFDRMVARQVHIFDSRTAAFKDDAVLQENVILHARKGGGPENVLLTKSVGRDMAQIDRSSVDYEKIIDNSNGDHVVRVSTNRFENEVLDAMDALPRRFRASGFEISTGPVVTFRSTEFLRHERADDTAPLLWMHNVRPFVTRALEKDGKPTHIEVSDASKRLLVPSKTYLLLKRFTAKEEKRRLIAGIMTPADSYSAWVGLENHLNYVYRMRTELTENEAYGLAAFFNSAFVDRYFRAISGNTQVNATEIRGMPMPDEATLLQIGGRIKQLETKDPAAVERIVGQELHLPRHLIDQLIEVAQ
jgi:adenine-specific DNA-methyltransferase